MMRKRAFKRIASALTGVAVSLSATAFPAFADTYVYDPVCGGEFNDKLSSEEIDSAEIKPKITATKEVLTLEEARANPVRTINIYIDSGESNGYFVSTGIHYFADSRLTFIDNSKGMPDIKRGEATEPLIMTTNFDKIADIHNPNNPNMQNGIFIATSGSGDYGTDGLMYSFQVVLPDDVEEGDVFPIDIKYISNGNLSDLFTSLIQYSEKARAMQAYVFTKGIYNAEYNNNFKADEKDIERVPALADIKGEYDGYIAIEAPETDTPETDPPATPSSPVQWGKDNWNFKNNSASFGKGPYSPKISSSYKKVLADNLTNSEYQVIFKGYYDSANEWNTPWIEDEWEGSCYGMSSLLLLSNNNLFPYSKYGTGAKNLHDLLSPVENYSVSSLVNYYQMLQIKNVIQHQYRTIPKRTNKTNITEIMSLLDSNNTVLIGFKKKYWGGHAIIAYDYSFGSWTWNGVTYDGCINVIDPNRSTEYTEDCNIYFNSKTYNWIIPHYSEITSASGAVFNYIGADIDEINYGGYLSGTSKINVSNYVARIDAAAISENHSVSKVKNTNGNYQTQSSSSGDIVEDTSYIAGGSSSGISGYNLYDPDAAYRIVQNTPNKLQLTMDYENCLMRAGSAAGKQIIFDKNGYVEVDGEAADYNISMIFDDDHPTDWFSFDINGENADTVIMEKADNGYVLEADNLQNVRVEANNRINAASVEFSADYDKVLLYEIDVYTIGVAADTDGNGTYETTIAKSDKGVTGDINNDGKFNVADIITFQKWLLNDDPCLINWKYADIYEDDKLDVFDLCLMKNMLINK